MPASMVAPTVVASCDSICHVHLADRRINQRCDCGEDRRHQPWDDRHIRGHPGAREIFGRQSHHVSLSPGARGWYRGRGSERAARPIGQADRRVHVRVTSEVRLQRGLGESWRNDEDGLIFFTIRDNLLLSVSCGPDVTLTFSPPRPVTNGEFSFVRDDGVGFSGRIVAVSDAIGTIKLGSCESNAWHGRKQ
jgi:hypothetical protein